METKSPEEVIRSIVFDLKSQSITQREAALAIGKNPAVVSNFFRSNKRFSKNLAMLFHNAFGYNLEYLLYGEGQLKNKQTKINNILAQSQGISKNIINDTKLLIGLVSIAEDLIQLSNDEDAKRAWAAVIKGDFDEYTNSTKRLSERTGKQAASILARFIFNQTK